MIPLQAGASSEAAGRKIVTQYVAYHGLTADEHQARVDLLAPQGYRPVSLSVSGDPGDARYAAIWFLRDGPEWSAFHGFSAAQYQQRFDALVASGFVPIQVTATGSDSSAIFAAVFSKENVGQWFARHGLTWDSNAGAGSINFENQRAFDSGFIPICLTAYGAADAPRFAGVWVQNSKPTPWSWWWTDPVIYQNYFTALLHAKTRLASISVAPSQWILSVFRDESIGEWWARHGMTADAYQNEFDQRKAQGLEPLIVQAGGTGTGTRYASLFVRDDQPAPRRWIEQGSVFTGHAEFDAVIRAFMEAHAIRALTFAVSKKGRVLAKRAYTWAEHDYPTTQTHTVMRTASVTKILTCAAVDRLIKDGKLSSDTRAFGYLGISSALLSSQAPDPDVDKITVDQLATRQSGLQHDFGKDLRGIARRISSSNPVWPTRDTLVRYIYGEPLVARPGTGDNYSNSAFFVLTSIIEKASGRPYLEYLKAAVLAPLSITDVDLSATGYNARRPGEVASYDHPGVSPSEINMADDAIDPNAYGGQVVTENSEGVGALMMSAATIARLLATHAVWNIGAREVGRRYGIMDGTMSGAISRGDDIDHAYIFNRRVADAEQNAFTDQLDALLDRLGGALP
jgi:CubicO group peptidase (beta-lactamase class C family)